MADRGARYADKKLSEIDRELRKVYRQAQKELTEKLSDFNKRHRQKDREKRQQMDKGEISKQQYKDWLAGQVFMRGQWERKLDQVNQVMLHHNEQAMRIINDSRLDVFAENYYSEGFKAKWIIQDVGFNVYSTHAIARLLEKQPQILPKWKIDEEKDYKWNEKKVNNIIQQGIIQGESVDQIGKRLCEDLSSQNESKMTMFARTAITGAQNAGRQVQMEQSAAAGIKVNKRWIATLDNRTRDLHRARDGEEVPYDEEFSGGIEYPGDPTAPPEEVYNCRCTMETVYPEYADRSKEWREDETIDGVPYEEWKEEAKQRLEEKEARKQQDAPIPTKEQYEKKIASFDRRIEKLREQRAKLFEAEQVDKKKTDELLSRIFDLQDKKEAYTKSTHDDFGNFLGEDLKIKLPSGEEIAVKLSIDKKHDFPDGKGGVYATDKAYCYELPNGTKMYYKADIDKTQQTISPEMLIKAYSEVPNEITRLGQKAFNVVDYANPEDGYWAAQYNMPNFKSFMTAGDIATLWSNKSYDYDWLVTSIAHEAGHKIDKDNGDISLTQEWADAKALDKKHSGKDSTSDYADKSKSNKEDFADAVKKLVHERKEMETDFPHRLAIIERTLKNGKRK